MPRIPHVALLIETSREYARGLLRGVARYHQEFGPWSVFFEPHGLHDPPPAWLAHWKGDGILARIEDHRMADAILETGLPAVDLRGALSDLPLPFVGLDNRPISELGFRHLHDCGLKHFAFCGTPRHENPNQDLRCDYFVHAVEESGHACQVWLGGRVRPKGRSWEHEQRQISRWLQKLPKPVGIMTCHDDRGHQVLDACRRAELKVPDEVAVVSVDNDPHLCNLCTPALTSIDVQPSRIGYDAADLLVRMMHGAAAPKKPILLGPPRGIAARQSTDMLAINDTEVADAIRYIRAHATEGIRVSDIVARVTNAPSTIERRVKQVLGRTIKAEITRVQIARAKLLLSETELPVATIAIRAGFSEPKYFCEVFRKVEDVTATQFRQRFRNGT